MSDLMMERAREYHESNERLLQDILELENMNNSNNNGDDDDVWGNYMLNPGRKSSLMMNLEEENFHQYEEDSQTEIHMCDDIDKRLREAEEMVVIPVENTEEIKKRIQKLIIEKEIKNVEKKQKECQESLLLLNQREESFTYSMKEVVNNVDQSIFMMLDLKCAIEDIKLNQCKLLSVDLVESMITRFRPYILLEYLSKTQKNIYHAPYGSYSILVIGDYHVVELSPPVYI